MREIIRVAEIESEVGLYIDLDSFLYKLGQGRSEDRKRGWVIL